MEKNEATLKPKGDLKYGKEATELWNYVTNAAIDLFNGEIDNDVAYKRVLYFQEKIGRLVEREVDFALKNQQEESADCDEES